MNTTEKNRLSGISVGHGFETTVFGHCAGYAPYYKIQEANFETCLSEAIRVARDKGWNPHNTKRPLLEALRRSLKSTCESFGIKVAIEIWDCIGTRLDLLHGVDGFVRVARKVKSSKKKVWRYYSFDLTTGQKVSKNPRIHIIRPEDLQDDSFAVTARHICEYLFPEIIQE